MYQKPFTGEQKPGVVYSSTCFSVTLYYFPNSRILCAFSPKLKCPLSQKVQRNANSMGKQTILWDLERILMSLITLPLVNCIWLPLKPRTAVWMKMICGSASLKLQLFTNPEKTPGKQSAVCGACFQIPQIFASPTEHEVKSGKIHKSIEQRLNLSGS